MGKHIFRLITKTVQLPLEIIEEIEKQAKEKNVSQALFFREIIIKGLENEELTKWYNEELNK